jgi:hypothetical protein
VRFCSGAQIPPFDERLAVIEDFLKWLLDSENRGGRGVLSPEQLTAQRGGLEQLCRNFAVQRNLVYPASFRALLDQLGIDPNKEGEAFECMPVEDGCHLYGGWFNLVGEMVTAGERNYNPPDSRNFDLFFTTAHCRAPAFRGGPMLSIEFTTHVKWVLPESPQYRTASDNTRPA